jgi:Holliday junction resolvase RusA-like endonuclease
MRKVVQLTIQGKPLGKQRVKPSVRGGHVVMYTPEQTVNYETLIKLAFMDKYPNWSPWAKDVPLFSRVRAYYPISASTPLKRKALMLEGKIRPCVKVDLDNCFKIIWDALNQIAYADDCQIVHCIGEKWYSDQPRIEITFEEMV